MKAPKASSPFTLQEVLREEERLKALPPGAQQEDLEGNLWRKGWDEMWASSGVPIRYNSSALVARLNPQEEAAPKVVDKRAGDGLSLFG